MNAGTTLSGSELNRSECFYVEETVESVATIIRRSITPREAKRKNHRLLQLLIGFLSKHASSRGEPVAFSDEEISFLEGLAEAAPLPITYKGASRKVWGRGVQMSRRRLKNLALILHLKLEADPDNPSLILSLPGLGFQLGIVPDRATPS